MTLTDENIEFYLFQYKEGMLDAESVAAVEKSLEARPDWREMADLYDPTLKLPATPSMSYTNWKSLRDGGPKATKQKLLIPLWTRTIAAAACLLLFVITIIHFTNNPGGNTDNQLTAKADPIVMDSTPTMCTNTAKAQEIPSSNIRGATHTEFTLLAESTAVETPQGNANSTKQLQIVTPVADTNVYLPDTLSRELNDPMDQKVLYANVIDWDDIHFETPVSQREQMHNVLRRTTKAIASTTSSPKERREAIATAIEDRLLQNETINNIDIINIIASIE